MQAVAVLLTDTVHRALALPLLLTGGTRGTLSLLPLLTRAAATSSSRALCDDQARSKKKQQGEAQ
ncbi:MAG: hypothetical protein ACLGXA_02635 [Acidobacteriota bacterium]